MPLLETIKKELESTEDEKSTDADTEDTNNPCRPYTQNGDDKAQTTTAHLSSMTLPPKCQQHRHHHHHNRFLQPLYPYKTLLFTPLLPNIWNSYPYISLVENIQLISLKFTSTSPGSIVSILKIPTTYTYPSLPRAYHPISKGHRLNFRAIAISPLRRTEKSCSKT
jgi:hypothetical protein